MTNRELNKKSKKSGVIDAPYVEVYTEMKSEAGFFP